MQAKIIFLNCKGKHRIRWRKWGSLWYRFHNCSKESQSSVSHLILSRLQKRSLKTDCGGPRDCTLHSQRAREDRSELSDGSLQVHSSDLLPSRVSAASDHFMTHKCTELHQSHRKEVNAYLKGCQVVMTCFCEPGGRAEWCSSPCSPVVHSKVCRQR